MLGCLGTLRGTDSFGVHIKDAKNHLYTEKKDFSSAGYHSDKLGNACAFFQTYPDVYKDVNFKNYNIIFQHNRTKSSGAVNLRSVHPYVIKYEKDGKKYYMTFMHNGTLTNVEELCNKYDIKEKDFSTDSEILGYLICNHGTEVLKYYAGTAAAVWYLSEDPSKVYFWKGADKVFKKKKEELEDERPLNFFPVKDGIYFSSLVESLQAVIPSEDTYYTIQPNAVSLFINGHYKSYERIERSPLEPVYTGYTNAYGGRATNFLPAAKNKSVHYQAFTHHLPSYFGMLETGDSIDLEYGISKIGDPQLLYYHTKKNKNKASSLTVISRELAHGVYRLDRNGRICGIDSEYPEMTSIYYFLSGHLIKDAATLNRLVANSSINLDTVEDKKSWFIDNKGAFKDMFISSIDLHPKSVKITLNQGMIMQNGTSGFLNNKTRYKKGYRIHRPIFSSKNLIVDSSHKFYGFFDYNDMLKHDLLTPDMIKIEYFNWCFDTRLCFYEDVVEYYKKVMRQDDVPDMEEFNIINIDPGQPEVLVHESLKELTALSLHNPKDVDLTKLDRLDYKNVLFFSEEEWATRNKTRLESLAKIFRRNLAATGDNLKTPPKDIKTEATDIFCEDIPVDVNTVTKILALRVLNLGFETLTGALFTSEDFYKKYGMPLLEDQIGYEATHMGTELAHCFSKDFIPSYDKLVSLLTRIVNSVHDKLTATNVYCLDDAEKLGWYLDNCSVELFMQKGTLNREIMSTDGKFQARTIIGLVNLIFRVYMDILIKEEWKQYQRKPSSSLMSAVLIKAMLQKEIEEENQTWDFPWDDEDNPEGSDDAINSDLAEINFLLALICEEYEGDFFTFSESEQSILLKIAEVCDVLEEVGEIENPQLKLAFYADDIALKGRLFLLDTLLNSFKKKTDVNSLSADNKYIVDEITELNIKLKKYLYKTTTEATIKSINQN